ncbi:MAG: protein kinase [Polyangiaceae bacterium]|nr:protein kinase [Polyangiaceae bacterium]
MTVAATTPFGPFVLERRIAVGGTAEVYLARPKLGTRPAPVLVVKRLLGGATSDEDFGALEREATLHQAVSHPNVVRVFGAGMVGTEPYLAMEYVEGVDLYRLLRRVESEQRPVPAELGIYVAHEIAEALDSVHDARDASGQPLGIVHRDVTPSNIYLSVRGEVKLGDFGIARVGERAGPPPSGRGLKGKLGYLAPEQIAGEPADGRADLFALGAVLGEILIGERVFPGQGQLAVLLAIRDGNLEPLERQRENLPPGLHEVLTRALARDPAARYATGAALAAALVPFLPTPRAELAATLAQWVRWAQDQKGLASRIEGQIRDSVERMRAVRARSSGRIPAATPPPSSSRPGGSSWSGLADVLCADGRRMSDLPFARLVELVASGDVGALDEVSVLGEPFRAIRDIPELARHLLPSTSATTGRLFAAGVPDYHVDLAETPMLAVLAALREKRADGALFVERMEQGSSQRKEIYLQQGKLHHVASYERDDRLGEYLVRRGALAREQLDAALRAVARNGGRLGDTLVALGLVEATDVFRALRDMGRDRVATLCTWSRGHVTFYRGTTATRVEFPLALDLATAMMAGAMLMGSEAPRATLPMSAARWIPGPRHRSLESPDERGTAPASLQEAANLAAERLAPEAFLTRVQAGARAGRVVSEREACAAVRTALSLGWLEAEG